MVKGVHYIAVFIIAALAILRGFDGGTAQICITGIVAVLTAALGLKGKGGGESNGPTSA